MDPAGPILPVTNRPPLPLQQQQQQRPSLTYFLFLSLLFYLINTNNNDLANNPNFNGHLQGGDGGDGEHVDPTLAYFHAQSRLLVREARATGLEQWLEAGGINSQNETGGWLNSTYYPDLANGTAPVALPPSDPSISNETSLSPAWSIPSFTPSFAPSLPPVVPLAQALFAAHPRAKVEEQERVFPQNLTGFGKGGWEVMGFGWGEGEGKVGVNETWSEMREVEVVQPEKEEEAKEGDVGEEGGAQNGTLAEAGKEQRVERERRQASLSPPTSAGNVTTPLRNSSSPSLLNSTLSSTDSARNFTTVLTTFNRTVLRGSFPWLSSASSSSSSPPSSSLRPPLQRVTLNLRSLQTSATGPIVPLPSGLNELDDGELLALRDEEKLEEWERLGAVVYVGGDIKFINWDEESGMEVETDLDFEGVHFLSTGHLYGFATPSFMPSHLYQTVSLPFSLSSPPSLPTNATALAIGHTMLVELRRRISKSVTELESSRFGGPIYSESNAGGGAGGGRERDPSIPQCVFSLFGSLAPLPETFNPSLYTESYRSLFHPSGSSTPTLPPSSLSALLSSPNCGLILSLPSISLTPTQSLWRSAVHFAVLLGLAHVVLLVTTVRQLERASARPGTIANVAVLGVASGCLMDAYTGVTVLTIGVVTYTRASLPLLACAFFGILSSALFGLRYIALIREATPEPTRTMSVTPAVVRAVPVVVEEVREEVGEEAEREAGEGEALLAAEEGEGGRTAATPPPVPPLAAVTPAEAVPPLFQLPSASPRDKFILTLTLLTVIFGLYLLFWWGWTPLLLWLLYSYWTPQIIKNVHRGTSRQSFSTEYVLGQTLARLVLPVYFWGYEGNCLQVETSSWVYLLVSYTLAQASLLLLQSRFSSPSSAPPSSFLPSLPRLSRSSPLYRLSLLLPSLPLLSPLFSLLPAFGTSARFFLPLSLISLLDLPSLTSWDYHPLVPPASLLADLQPPSNDVEAQKSARETGGLVEPDCPICLCAIQIVPYPSEEKDEGRQEEVRRARATTPCRHVVHTECLEQWISVKAACPVCRQSLPPLG